MVLRCFVAIELPEEVKSTLSEMQEELKKLGADIRWIKPDNIHLTLKFLGHIKEESIEKITDTMKTVSGGHRSFNIFIRGIGIFPNITSPRVLWVGIDNNNPLMSLQKDIENSLSLIGLDKEKKPFTAHLTLGRFRSRKGKEILLDAVQKRKNDGFGELMVSKISLMKSDLHPSGARYTKLSELSFQRQDN
jgi:2'-5' RNA ligase